MYDCFCRSRLPQNDQEKHFRWDRFETVRLARVERHGALLVNHAIEVYVRGCFGLAQLDVLSSVGVGG